MRAIEYFAYGSNMNHIQMELRCPESEVIGTVRLEGYRLAFAGGSGVATILPSPGSHVDGVLWEISAEDEQRLDYYEGFPRLYGKESVTVRDKAGAVREVMAYTMNPPYRDERAMPNVPYLYGIVEGCTQNGIGTDLIFDALRRTESEVMSQQGRGDKSRKGPER